MRLLSSAYARSTWTRACIEFIRSQIVVGLPTGWAKKLHTAFFAITLPTLNNFFNIFWHIYIIGNLQLDDA